MVRRRALTAEEAALWRAVARRARPLPGKALPPEPEPEHGPELGPAPPPAAIARAPAATPPAPSAKIPLRTVKPPPADRGGEKRVRRGKLEIAASLDLHGHTQDQARAALARFLAGARAEGAGVVLVVTGKGGRRPIGDRDGGAASAALGEGVLRRQVPGWLASGDLRAHVAGYAQAHARHGGAGALYVFLKRRSTF